MMQDEVSQTSSSSADEERRLLNVARESSGSEGSVGQNNTCQYETELALVKKASAQQAAVKLVLPAVRTAMHAGATALNPFGSVASTDSRIMATAFATMLTYGFLPLRQLRTRDDALTAAISELHDDLLLLEVYPKVDARLVEALRHEIDALTAGEHKLDYVFMLAVSLMMLSSVLGAIFSVLRTTGLVDDKKWLSGAVEGSSFVTAAMIVFTFVVSGFSSFYGKTYGRLAQVDQLSDRIKRHMENAHERSRAFLQGLGINETNSAAMLHYLQANAKFKRTENNLRKDREALEVATSNQALLQETAKSSMLKLLGNADARRIELQTDLKEVQHSLNKLNDNAWTFLEYSEILSELITFLDTLPEKPEALLPLVIECNAIQLSELTQYRDLKKRDAFTKNCLSSLGSDEISQTALLNAMTESLLQICPNVDPFNKRLNKIILELTAIQLPQNHPKQNLLSTIRQKLEMYRDQLNFSDPRLLDQPVKLKRLFHHYEERGQEYNRLLRIVEQQFMANVFSSAFFKAPRFKKVEPLAELLLSNQELQISTHQKFDSDHLSLS